MPSSSSSRSLCCAYPVCSGGVACERLTNWYLDGFCEANVPSCTLYVLLDSFDGPLQQVEIYSDAGYLNLVAIGQNSIGTIILEERNNSGISGTVVWNGVPVEYPSPVILLCDEVSSSSLSSLGTTSSSSSISSSSSSSSVSSSSGCCQNPNCVGTDCEEFSEWTLAGMSDSNTDDCKLYLSFDYFDSEQQVKLFKDAARIQLVAVGQGSGLGILLEERNNSGISGTVVWSGYFARSAAAYLDCFVSSSSQPTLSSSSSSISSSSSSSINSTSSSSSSSSSSLSSESSSSSSIDSSSTSSESEGNTSSSSSSSAEIWNKTKPLILGATAINYSGKTSRVGQTIVINEEVYEIGNVFVYLYGPQGVDDSYTVYLDLYSCDDNGHPDSLIDTKSIAGSSIDEDDWYAFDFSVNGITPSNKFLCFVLRQSGGNDNNYVLWGHYVTSDLRGGKAIYLENNEWKTRGGILRSLKVAGNFDAFDLDNYRILTPSAPIKEEIGELENGGFNQTALYKSEGDYERDYVGLSYPNIFLSFVMDSSGSMGWNDRFSDRVEFLTKTVNRFLEDYPESVLIDIVNFGSQTIDATSVFDGLGKAMTINLDLNYPTRTSYILTVEGASAASGTIYTHNGVEYTVQQDVSNGDSLIVVGEQSPLASGEMTKKDGSGSGDNTISFTSIDTMDISKGIVGYGFKNFEGGHTYNVGPISVDGVQLDFEGSSNWNSFSPVSTTSTLSDGNNGPKGENSLDIFVEFDSFVIRRSLGIINLVNSPITSPVAQDDLIVNTSNASAFVVGDYVDIMDGEIASIGREITAIPSGSQIQTAQVNGYNINDNASFGGIVQNSNFLNAIVLDGTTAQILVRDVDVTSNSSMTFYLQTIEGLTIEWDFVPYAEWHVYNIYYWGETALLPIEGFDMDGQPLPDFTKVFLYVDEVPEPTTDILVTQKVVKKSVAGSNKVYVSDNSSYSVGGQIDIITGEDVQTSTVIEKGSDASGDFLIIFPPLGFEVSADLNSKILEITDDSEQDFGSQISTATLLPSVLSMINVTSIVAGSDIPSSILKEYDDDPLPASTPYSDLNLDRERIKFSREDIPFFDGIAAIRILPITEDNLKTIQEKSKDENLSVTYDQSDEFVITQLLQEENDEALAEEEEENATTTTITTPSGDELQKLLDQSLDPTTYQIESPVFLLNGIAKSAFTTFDINLEPTTVSGLSIPVFKDGKVTRTTSGGILAKSYTVFPAISTDGALVSKQYLESFEVLFVTPYSIYSSFGGPGIAKVVDLGFDEDCKTFNGYATKVIPGDYAEGDGFSIDYTVLFKNALLSSGDLRIRIYSNPVVDRELVARFPVLFTNTEFNGQPPKQYIVEEDGVTFNIVQPLSQVDQWRQDVQNNPEAKRIQDASVATGGLRPNEDSTIGRAVSSLENAGFEFAGSKNKLTAGDVLQYYQNPNEWVVADQYQDFQEITIPVVNGRATLTLPSSEIETLLMVEASIAFGDGNAYETIRNDLVFIESPIEIETITPFKIYALGEDFTYEVGVNVKWRGEIIDDNVSVLFAPVDTRAIPSVSKTDDGWAGGIYLGPHKPVVMTCREECLCYGEYEEIDITVSYLGRSRTVGRWMEWIGRYPGSGGDETSDFAFFVTRSGDDFAWSDGGKDKSVRVNSDLSDFVNQSGPPWPGPEGQAYLLGEKQGKDGSDTTPRGLWISEVYDGLQVQLDDRLWQKPDGTMSLLAYGVNRNIGDPISDQNLPNPPWRIGVRVNTAYRDPATRQYRFGTGSTAPPVIEIKGVDPATGEVITNTRYFLPEITFKEPLGIAVEIESYDSIFARDGSTSGIIVADVTWRGKAITGDITLNEGTSEETTIDYGFPTVRFEGGIQSESNVIPGGEDSPPIPKDTRNDIGGALRIGSHPNVSLSASSVKVSLSRTDKFTYQDATHTHACTVDSEGNGQTTSTIYLNGNSTLVPEHTHVISDHVALASSDLTDPNIMHTHQLRSVAITQLNPLTDPNVNIAINGYVIYDPTGSTGGGYGGQPLNNQEAYGDGSQGKRMMFSTLFLFSQVRERKLIVSLDTEKNYGNVYTARTVTETEKAFNLIASAKFSSYSIQVSPGVWEILPERPVEDGTRAIFEIEAYKALDAEETEEVANTAITNTEGLKRYMLVRAKITVNSEGLTGTNEIILPICSNLQWLPSVKGLLSEPTNDIKLIEAITDQIEFIGSSQIHDAVRLAAQRATQYQTDNPSWKSAKKMIFLVTDGDENISEYSINQAIQNVNFVNGNCQTPVFPVKLGRGYNADEVLMEKYSSGTCGDVSYLVGDNADIIDEIIDEIVTGDLFVFNKGTYSNSIDLEKFNMISTFSVSDVYLPTNTKITFRVRFGEDGITWGEWSEWYDSSQSIDLENSLASRGRYIEYQVQLFGNENFETPKLYAGLQVVYYDFKNFVVFFQPIDINIDFDEYVDSIYITHEGTIPDTSDVKYGFAQTDTTEIQDYSNPTRPLITPDRKSIILNRYNELFKTSNNRTYVAFNGGWPQKAEIEIYRVNDASPNGTLVDPSLYSPNPVEGSITFVSKQKDDDDFVICVNLDPLFRVACSVTNYGPQSVILDHIGIMYNIGKRIPLENERITHRPISKRIGS